MTLPKLVVLALQASLFLMVLAAGLHARPGMATSVLRDPVRLARSVVSMLVVMPVVAVLLGRLLDLEPAVRVALVALALSPVPPLWPGQSLKSGGDETYTIGLFVASALVAIVAIPLGVEVMQRVTDVPLRMPAGTVARLVGTSLLLPLVLGLALARLAPSFAARARPLAARLSTVLLLAGAVPLVVRVWPAMRAVVGNGSLLAMAAFAAVGIAAGHRLAGDPPARRTALALATASRHPAIAVAIAHATFPGEKLAPAAILLYLLVSAIATKPYVRRMRDAGARAQAPRVERRASRLRRAEGSVGDD